MVRTLVEAGVESAVISPGSRSTPIVLAAQAARGLRCYCIVDERSAAFFALGQARITGRPSLLICTSGTAAANYFPAVIEAKLSGLPLLILSADRPSELQYCGAPQTLDQTKLFGGYAEFLQLGEASFHFDAQLALRRSLRTGMAHAVERPSGPVHFNFQVRKPLEFSANTSTSFGTALPALAPIRVERSTTTSPHGSVISAIVGQITQAKNPIVIAGAYPVGAQAATAALTEYLRASGSLLCPEAVSQLRLGDTIDTTQPSLDGFDWLFSHAPLDDELEPDFILQLGAPPISSGLQRLLERCRNHVPLVICVQGGEADTFHRSAQILKCDLVPLLKSLTEGLSGSSVPKRDWERWHQVNQISWQCVEEALSIAFTEARAVAELVEQLPDNSCLMVGNSLAPRHLDRYSRASAKKLIVGSQRGASGIEGAVASAFGAATVHNGPLTLLIGDISFLHDLSGLWAASPERTQSVPSSHPVVVVVLNNGGGRIFEQLPVAQQQGVSLGWWTTPHKIQLSGLAAAFEIGYTQVTDSTQLGVALGTAYQHNGVSLVEILVPESGSQQAAQQVQAALAKHLKRGSAVVKTGAS